MKTETFDIIILPTTQINGLYKRGGELRYAIERCEHESWTPQHLYAISDEPIKEGDWCYDSLRNCICQKSKTMTCNGGVYKKVICTTDESLTHKIPMDGTDYVFNLPQLPTQFIKTYAEQGGIDEVVLEIIPMKTIDNRDTLCIEGGSCSRQNTTCIKDHSGYKSMTIPQKLNNDNNEVVVVDRYIVGIDPYKEKMYSRENVLSLIREFEYQFVDPAVKTSEWIEENLK